jgi:hypothetical protein
MPCEPSATEPNKGRFATHGLLSVINTNSLNSPLVYILQSNQQAIHTPAVRHCAHSPEHPLDHVTARAEIFRAAYE